VRGVFFVAFVVLLLAPAWWAAGRLQRGQSVPFFQFLTACGLALVGYLSYVNLVGRLFSNSIIAIVSYLILNAVALAYLWRRWPGELNPSPVIQSWRTWNVPVIIGVIAGIPQWILAVSTNFYDEVVASAIHITGPNQFAEGVFPPRHNALPDVVIKYHYGVMILNGTVRWLTGLSTNVSIDVVSTSLWLFVFLFVYFWLRELEFDRAPATWGGFTVLLGGGLAWLYLPHIEAYKGIEKNPPISDLGQKFDSARSWFENLKATGNIPSLHLRNADGSLSNLPWDISAMFQQHAVALGITLAVFAMYLLVMLLRQEKLHIPLLVLCIVTFSVVFLGHAVFGTVSALTAGLCLLTVWIKQPTRWRFIQGLAFGIGMAVIAVAHGGLLRGGEQYGAGAATTFRHTFGYPVGGLMGFINWNIAGFGIPLILALVGVVVHALRREKEPTDRRLLFSALSIFAVISWLVPQLVFYSSESAGVEQFTEISKFFFVTHLAFALLSVFGIAYVLRKLPWPVILPLFALMAVTPLTLIYTNAFKQPEGKWMGFYRAPYFPNSIEQQMAEAFARMKKTNHDVYFDASADERKHGYLSEILYFGGSAFTATPSAYERTGIGYRLGDRVVSRQFVLSSRMWRLLPGAAEDCHCTWYYARPVQDMTEAPIIMRSRLEKAVAQGYFVKRFSAGLRALFSIDKPTKDLDDGIERYWTPHVISQSKLPLNAAANDLTFYDYKNRKLVSGTQSVALPIWISGEFVLPFAAKLPGDSVGNVFFGRLEDTRFRFGIKIEDIVERSDWGWTYRDAKSGAWKTEVDQWMWDWDMPVITDVNHDGFDDLIAYRIRTKEWLQGPFAKLYGPTADPNDLPVPFAGRFLNGSSEDLGLWILGKGMVSLQSLNTGQKIAFQWANQGGDILVNGDYDGDGYDEIGVYHRANGTWDWRRAPDGPITHAAFGTPTSLPLPADYNHDGKLDLAIWEPAQQKILVSYSHGRTVDYVVTVPPNSIPAFVNMY
jgi:hypothetical protein